MRKMSLTWPLVVPLAFVLVSPAFAAKRLDVPLVWKPTNQKAAGVVNLSGLSNLRIQIEPFVDARADKAKFGENQEDRQPRPVTTTDSVAEFCARNVGNVLRQYGLNVVPDGGDVVIGAEVLEFMVIETNTYKGDVRLKISVKKQGRTQWVGVASGAAGHWGRSFKADNYYETISDSLQEAATNLIQDQGFSKALLAE